MSQEQNTAIAVRLAGLDKFYTNPDIAEKCINIVGNRYNWNCWDKIIEPSAGNGNFYNRIPVSNNIKIAYDIQPEGENIICRDFFTIKDTESNGSILIIGNPPFGRVSSLAVKFFNHAANICKNNNKCVIAFIIPRTFRRPSIQNKLNTSFHLVYDEDIPITPCSFTPNMAVKCCFQIWEKQNIPRAIIIQEKKNEDWEFIQMGALDERGQPTPPTGADFALRAYGGKCGDIVDKGLELLRPKSWHWIKVNTNKITKNELIARFIQLDYSISKNTARQNSIGRAELVALYNSIF